MSLYVVCMSVNRSAECRLICLSSYIVCRFDFLALYLQNKTVSKFVQISLRCIHCRTPTALLPPTPLCISEDRFRKQCWYRLAMPVLRCSAAMFGEPHFGSIDPKLLFFPFSVTCSSKKAGRTVLGPFLDGGRALAGQVRQPQPTRGPAMCGQPPRTSPPATAAATTPDQTTGLRQSGDYVKTSRTRSFRRAKQAISPALRAKRSYKAKTHDLRARRIRAKRTSI